MALIECVPNISEGQDLEKIQRFAQTIESIPGVKLLNLDTGVSANRTVYTFVGTPEAVCEAAFQLFSTAKDLLDMRSHRGAHPRQGIIDICPLIPLEGISLEETTKFAARLANRISEELNLPLYLYEENASNPERKNLANLRRGEYESLPEKFKTLPTDFSNEEHWEKFGVCTIGARKLLVAFNINLDTNDINKAKAIAENVRESGKVVIDAYGKRERKPGKFKSVKAIGWYIKDFDKVQVSYNLTDISQAGILDVFLATQEEAGKIDCRVTGSELIGLAPLSEFRKAGTYFMGSIPSTDPVLIRSAIDRLGLSEIRPFISENKIIEHLI